MHSGAAFLANRLFQIGACSAFLASRDASSSASAAARAAATAASASASGGSDDWARVLAEAGTADGEGCDLCMGGDSGGGRVSGGSREAERCTVEEVERSRAGLAAAFDVPLLFALGAPKKLAMLC